MVASFSVHKGRSDEQAAQYAKKLARMNLAELVKEFFSYLDYVDESEGGTEFHPISIGSCRVLMTEPLGMCMEKLKGAADGKV